MIRYEQRAKKDMWGIKYMRQTPASLTMFISIISALVVIGCVFIYSSSSIFALETRGDAAYFLYQHLRAIVLALCAGLCGMLLPYRLVYKGAPWFFLAMLILNMFTQVPGIGVCLNGARRWISIAGIIIQPSELLKVGSLIYCAYFLDRHRYQLLSFMRGYLPFMIIMVLTGTVLLLQSDFGQTVLIALTALLMWCIAQCSMQHLLLSAALFIPAALILVLTKPYRVRRLLAFVNPWQDPLGSGFQIIQSLVAIGSGGLTGLGLAQSRQKFFYLPMQHTDFIFAIIAEESGLIGSLLIVGLYTMLLITGMKLAKHAHHPFTSLVVAGTTLMITMQAQINILSTMGLLPPKGIGLPFISYGSSSLIAYGLLIGICCNGLYDEDLA